MAATKIKSGKSLYTDAVSPVNNIFKKLSKSSEWYSFRKQPIGCIYSAAATTASKSGRMTNEARIYFAFKTMRKETPVDETLEKIIFKHDTLEVNLISALRDSLDAYPLLTVIKFEFCQLTARHIEELAEFLYQIKSVKEISVNGNPIPEQNYHLLLQREIICVSFKYCNINAEGMKYIYQELCTPHENPLLHLNLASNDLYDEGAFYVGKLLRINRKLLSVNLADNKITSTGVGPILKALQKFEIDEDEIIERRKIRFDYQRKIMDSMYRHKEGKKSRSIRNRSRISERQSIIIPEATIELPYHPALQDSVEENGRWFCSGNNVLSQINLSYNKIKKDAVPYFLDMLDYQKLQYTNNPDTLAITKISLAGNPLTIEDLYQIQSTLEKKFSNSSISTTTSLTDYQEQRIQSTTF